MEFHPTLRPFARTLLCASIILFANFTACQRAQAEPYIPEDDAMILERLPVALGPEAREIRRLRTLLSEEPDNLVAALTLAGRYREIGRAESDPRYYGYAEAVLGPWWQAKDPPHQVRVMRALLSQARHDFAGAQKDLDAVLAESPSNAQARLARATVSAATGDPAAAADDCKALRRNRLVRAACLGHSESLTGRAEAAYASLSQALGRDPAAQPAIRVWALTVLGEIAWRQGQPASAEEHFRSALSLGEHNAYLLGALADLLLDQDRPAEVMRLLRGETRSDGLLLRLAIAARQLEDPEAPSYIQALEARFAATRTRGSSLHLREEARFALHLKDDPEGALRLARENWRVQREPADLHILLEAALAVGNPQAAEEALDWRARYGLEDRRIDLLVAQLEEAAS